MNAWKPTDEQIEALAKQWINDWDTRADEHEDWIADFHDLIASDAGQSILRAAQAEAKAAGFAAGIRSGCEVGWDAAVGALRYEDGSPVEIAEASNPYRAYAEGRS